MWFSWFRYLSHYYLAITIISAHNERVVIVTPCHLPVARPHASRSPTITECWADFKVACFICLCVCDAHYLCKASLSLSSLVPFSHPNWRNLIDYTISLCHRKRRFDRSSAYFLYTARTRTNTDTMHRIHACWHWCFNLVGNRAPTQTAKTNSITID